MTMTPEKLLHIREEILGITMKEMSKRLNVPYSTYRKWESGDRRIPLVLKTALNWTTLKAVVQKKDHEEIAGCICGILLGGGLGRQDILTVSEKLTEMASEIPKLLDILSDG